MAADDLYRIETLEIAQGVATAWAHEHRLAVRNFDEFASDWFLQTLPESRVRINLRATLESFHSVCKHYETEWTTNAALLADLTSSWNLETVKHLAVFNVAGIAGAAALLTNTAYASQITTKLALPFFAAGLVLALLNFWTNTRGYALAYKHAVKQRRAAASAREWKDVAAFLEGFKGKFTPTDWFSIAESSGWTSAMFGIAGVACLGVSLM
ncbi:hypothetical protein [Achromobacter kerstersii]